MKIIYKVFNLQSYMEEFAIRIESMDVEAARDATLAFFKMELLLKTLNGYSEPIVVGSLAHVMNNLEQEFEAQTFESQATRTNHQRIKDACVKILKDVTYMNKKDVRYFKSGNVPLNNIVELIETCINKLDGHSSLAHWEGNHFVVHDPLLIDNLHLVSRGAYVFEGDLELMELANNHLKKAERH